MCIKDIAHAVALNSQGGIASLAARMSVPYSTLKSKLNPNCDTHHLSVQDLERIVDLVDTDDVARYFAAQRDGVFVKSRKLDFVSDSALLELFLEREERYGRFAKRVREALEDGGIDEDEYADLMRLFDQVSETREQIKQRLTQLHEQTVERGHHGSVRAVK